MKCRKCGDELLYAGENDEYTRYGCANKECKNYEIAEHFKKHKPKKEETK